MDSRLRLVLCSLVSLLLLASGIAAFTWSLVGNNNEMSSLESTSGYLEVEDSINRYYGMGLILLYIVLTIVIVGLNNLVDRLDSLQSKQSKPVFRLTSLNVVSTGCFLLASVRVCLMVSSVTGRSITTAVFENKQAEVVSGLGLLFGLFLLFWICFSSVLIICTSLEPQPEANGSGESNEAVEMSQA